MIDNITILIRSMLPGVEPDDRPFEYKNILFKPVFNDEGQVYRFDANFNGLRLKYKHIARQLSIVNSLHKSRKGNNYDDFRLTELKEEIEGLSDHLSIDVAAGHIKKIEYGCNILVNDVNNVVNSLLSYRGKEYQPMTDKSNRYGTSCELSQYSIKCYNKTYQSKEPTVPDNLLRWEIRVKNVQSLYKRKEPIPIFKVKDLTDPGCLHYLSKDLLEKYNETIKGPLLDFSRLSLRKMTAYARMSNRAIKDEMQQQHIHTYADDKRLYKRILTGYKAPDAESIHEKLVSKCMELING